MTGEFEQLYQGLHARVTAFCARLIGCRTAAADLAQDVFVKAYASQGEFTGRSSEATWVFRIAWNACADHLRRERTRRGAMVRLVSSGLPPAEDMESRVADREAAERILERISPRSRALLMLRLHEGLGYEEMARIFDTTPGSIGVMLNRARKEALAVAREEGIAP